MAAEKAMDILRELDYPGEYLQDIAHAIEAHSFSAKITPRTLEAKVVQDADRIDALGAVGIARCLLTAGVMDSSLYSPLDPFCREREPDDRRFAVDHFYTKLFRLKDSFQTRAARVEAEARTAYMQHYLEQLQHEISF